MSVTFRPAISADAEAIADVYLTSRKELVPFAPLAHPDDDVRRWIREILLDHCEVTVAVLDGEIVGMMALLRRDDGNWIDQLYLHPRVVGQGIGSNFVAQAKATLEPPIRLYTFQENVGAIRFYERWGFRPIAYGDGSGNEEGCPDVLLIYP